MAQLGTNDRDLANLPRYRKYTVSMKMRIAINTLAMKRELYGVGNYIKNLVWALSGIDRENEYVLFASADNACHLKGLGENFCIEFAPSNRMLRLPWEQ